MDVTLTRVLCSSSTFMGHLHFCSGDIPFLIQTPSLRMTGFQRGGGGGGGGRFFFKRNPQKFYPADKFFKGANMQRTNPSDFIFQRAATKI